jgi:hypothetical protein
MPRSGKVLLAVTVLMCALGGLWVAKHRVPEPIYGGLPFSEHLYRIYWPTGTLYLAPAAFAMSPDQRASREALARAGRETLPLITNWIASEPGPWKPALARKLQRLSFHVPSLSADHRKTAFFFLGDFPVTNSAQELFPLLISILRTNRDPWEASQVSRALERSVAPGLRDEPESALRIFLPLFETLKENDYDTVARYNPGGSPADSLRRIIDGLDPKRDLRPLLTLEFGPEAARVGAARELQERPRQPQRAVALLVRNLESTNGSVQQQCALALPSYGADAARALPALSNLLASRKPRVRAAAEKAIAALSRPAPSTPSPAAAGK